MRSDCAATASLIGDLGTSLSSASWATIVPPRRKLSSTTTWAYSKPRSNKSSRGRKEKSSFQSLPRHDLFVLFFRTILFELERPLSDYCTDLFLTAYDKSFRF